MTIIQEVIDQAAQEQAIESQEVRVSYRRLLRQCLTEGLSTDQVLGELADLNVPADHWKRDVPFLQKWLQGKQAIDSLPEIESRRNDLSKRRVQFREDREKTLAKLEQQEHDLAREEQVIAAEKSRAQNLAAFAERTAVQAAEFGLADAAELQEAKTERRKQILLSSLKNLSEEAIEQWERKRDALVQIESTRALAPGELHQLNHLKNVIDLGRSRYNAKKREADAEISKIDAELAALKSSN